MTTWERDEYEMTEKWVRVNQNEYELTWVRIDLSTNWLHTPDICMIVYIVISRISFAKSVLSAS